MVSFSEEEKVVLLDYRENANKWTDGKITDKSGPLSYKVTTGDQGTWRLHADQTFYHQFKQQDIQRTARTLICIQENKIFWVKLWILVAQHIGDTHYATGSLWTRSFIIE